MRLIETLITIGTNPEITRADLARRLGVAPNTAFQDLRTLSFEKRNGDRGLGLIEGQWDVFDMRQRRYKVTARGDWALERLSAIMD